MRWTGFKTLIIRECGVMARFWSVTLAPPILMTILYLVIFGEIMGRRIGAVDGVDYIRYVAPGLVLLWAIPYSYGHTAAGFLGTRLYRYIEELLVSPLPGWLIMTAYVASGMIRGLVVAAAVGATVLLFTPLRVHSILLSAVVLLLAVLVCSLAGFITANVARTFDHVTTVQMSIVVPLTYLSGAFIPLAALPDWARDLSLANPVFYLTNAFRYGVLGVTDVPVRRALTLISVFAITLVVVATWTARTSAMRDFESS